MSYIMDYNSEGECMGKAQNEDYRAKPVLIIT